MLQKLRYLKYRYDYITAHKKNRTTPVDVSLELSSFCTNQCGYCYHSDTKDLPFKRGKMSHGLAISILNQAAELGVQSVKFNSRGESTMNQYFNAITYHAKSLAHGSVFIDRITNSNFNFAIDNESVFKGLCNQTKVKVSFDSFRKDIFEKQRKGSNYEKTLANMSKFYHYPGRDNEMVVQAVRTALNADEDLEGEIKKRFPSATASVRDVVSGRTKKDISEIETKKRSLDNRQSCIQAHARLMINWDGKVQVCCPDIGSKLLIGDANRTSLDAIWNSPQAKAIRDSLKNKTAFNFDPCKTCSSFESYSGFKPLWNS